TPLHLNQHLWDALKLGRGSAAADWFDFDWDLLDGRVGLPLLGAPLPEVLSAEQLKLERLEGSGEPTLAYHEQRFPLAPGTEDGTPAEVLARQNYALTFWRHKNHTLGYRRFFDVDTLVALQVERPEVFEATHRELVSLHRNGIVDGFRIDHPDGLADPQGYLEQLCDATGGAWVVVEKILEGDERLPGDWPTAGTTGYDAARVITQALAPVTGPGLDERWRSTGVTTSLHEVELEAKRLVRDALFAPEVERLTRAAIVAAADAELPTRASRLRDALREILAEVEVYRAYLRPGHPADKTQLDRLADQVVRAIDARPALGDTAELLFRLLTDVDTTSAAGRDLLVRFQQVCGPVMAKGVEDTTFYRWHRLVALNEVGGDPAGLDDPSDKPMHVWASYQQQHHPAGLTALSTHDTKRSEDVRARLLAVAGDLAGWDAVWEPVRRLATEVGVDLPTAYLVMQTVLGAWPLPPDRLTAYIEKAIREAKQHTNWNDPDLAYEERVKDLALLCLTDPDVVEAVESTLADRADTIRALTLGGKLLQLTLPGVPDVYQGCETLDLSLVDPDNRRPVGFGARAQRLADLDAGKPPADLSDEKLLVTSRALRLRRERPELFDAGSSYAPLPFLPAGLVGFVRAERVAVVATTGREAPDGVVRLPGARWRDLLTATHHSSGTIPVDMLLEELPVALLVKDSS
ncbi:MAG: malto-oligosyltrehalose synthase, partial [Nocardioidaceae bacterium]